MNASSLELRDLLKFRLAQTQNHVGAAKEGIAVGNH
jgi:hypothetical protein